MVWSNDILKLDHNSQPYTPETQNTKDLRANTIMLIGVGWREEVRYYNGRYSIAILPSQEENPA